MRLTIVSGGQTGADRGGLDAAIYCGIPHGGWCPKGRRAEDGVIPDRYRLTETSSSGYPIRTELNVVNSDCTLVFTPTRFLGRGSALTMHLCDKHRKSVLHVNLFKTEDEVCAGLIAEWLTAPWFSNLELTVNVAGSRESKAPGIQARTCLILVKWLGNSKLWFRKSLDNSSGNVGIPASFCDLLYRTEPNTGDTPDEQLHPSACLQASGHPLYLLRPPPSRFGKL